jgi:hypothetical protein
LIRQEQGGPNGPARVLSGLAGAAGVLLLSGCVEPDPDHSNGNGLSPLPGIAELSIDAGETLTLEPGQGVGIAVAYAGDGAWDLALACDTLTSGANCLFDVWVSSDDSPDGISGATGRDLEDGDRLVMTDPFALRLDFLTEADNDGVGFRATPGATLRVSASLYDPAVDSRLGWSDDPRIISWVGHGAVNWGAPTNPVDLTPDRP